VHALLGLLAVWPQPYEANTPKEVLLLHELETLLQMATPEDFISLCKPILNRLVMCIGADTDNFRTMQRAMQVLKNNKILKLFGSSRSPAATTSPSAGSAKSIDDSSKRNSEQMKMYVLISVCPYVRMFIVPTVPPTD
jgi:hypothetical protein